MASVHTLTSEPDLPQTVIQTRSKPRRLRAVLGLGPSGVFSDSETAGSGSIRRNGTAFRRRDRSIDGSKGHTKRRKALAEQRANINDLSFFDESTTVEIKREDLMQPAALSEMKRLQEIHPVAPRYHPGTTRRLRVDDQRGPWTVTVMEAPHNAHTYTLYVKSERHSTVRGETPDHILHRKLREAGVGSLPKLPIDPSTLPPPPPKRKSNFLNTLTRLASPNGRVSRPRSSGNNQPSALSKPTSPNNITEPADPFSSVNATKEDKGPDQGKRPPRDSTTTDAIALFLTTLSNESNTREARPWKRFVRVRADDLDGERGVERPVAPQTNSNQKRKSTAIVLNEQGAKAAGQVIPKEDPADEGNLKTPVIDSGRPAEDSVSRPSQTPSPDGDDKLATPKSGQVDAASSHTETGDDSSVFTSDYTSPAARKVTKKKSQRKVVIDDFEMMRVLGKGCAGKVLLVRYKSSGDLYALKAITKRHVLAHQELQHTLTEQAVLKRMSSESKDPFVVKLWWSFHDKENLFLVMDFHPGGDLATQLARWGRLGRDRARFYAAEIVEGVEGLHAAGVIYRDLKPENILIGNDGHIVLTDFGLSKEFPRRSNTTMSSSTNGTNAVPATPPWYKNENGIESLGWPGLPSAHGNDTTTTFCGTAEYLAPEVIQGLAYSYEVDWWSFGTMLYEMLTGITPFWANNHSDMYVRVLHDELQFPEDRAIDQDTKSLIRGLLQRNPALRMCEPRVKKHPYFSMIDWSHVYYKRYIPPYIPPIDPSNASDTQNFDDTFLDMAPVLDDPNDNEQTDTDQERSEQTDTDRTDGEDSVNTPSQSRSPSTQPPEADDVDVFDGYSFKGRHSILIDTDEDEDGSELDAATDLTRESTPADTSAEVDKSADPVTEQHTPVASSTALPDIEVQVASPIERAENPMGKESNDGLKTPLKPFRNKLYKAPPSNRNSVGKKNRREKSGIQALDKDISDGPEEEIGDVTERDEEDEDWDFVGDAGVEDRNGTKGASLFARGVVDRYKLAVVFRKASTVNTSGSKSTSGGNADASDAETSEFGVSGKDKRGRSSVMTFRKHPRQFLRPKSPTSSSPAKSLQHSISQTLSLGTSSPAMLTPTTSSTILNSNTSTRTSPQLKTKESALSVGAKSVSSDQSGQHEPARISDNQTDAPGDMPLPVANSQDGTGEKAPKPNKLQKYKDGAEKVLQMFAPSSRPPTQGHP